MNLTLIMVQHMRSHLSVAGLLHGRRPRLRNETAEGCPELYPLRAFLRIPRFSSP